MGKTKKQLQADKLLKQYKKVYNAVAAVMGNINDPNIWYTKDGKEIPLNKLEDSHLENIVNKMNKEPGWRNFQRVYIDAEVKRRKQQKLAETTVAGKILYGTQKR